ncbi:MAG: Glu/Leu/Phe/Val dehydrogenase [Alphaproteobacteria bacterium]|nr:MAG: Glu/Leu/Phe/Val dehydrogenase [Alphaproteobacteria bacterium]
MSVFSHKEFDQHEQVSFFHDAATGLRAIIAMHNTNLGPALGGCRMWSYESDDAALKDVLRLSKGMTYKAAVAGLPLGGGKSVIIGDSKKHKTPELMRAMGRAVNSFGGQYIVAEDVGTTTEDMNHINSQTKHVVGIAGGAHGSGDPSPTTALGVFTGLKAAVRHRLQRNDLKGLKVAVQGLGNVGYNLCRHLHQAGAQLIVTDMAADKVDMASREFGAMAVALNSIYDIEADVFAPCALGGILNDDTLTRIKAKVIAGAANNQLAEARHGDVLRDMKVLYAPDYVINAGGLISVYYEHLARSTNKAFERQMVLDHVAKIDGTSESIFKRADQEGISTSLAADRIAEGCFKSKKACKAA